MAELADGTEAALAILKGWQWGTYDPDGFSTGSTIVLNEVVNRLAFQGHDDPAKAVLMLLTKGKLTAICDYQWMKYRHSQRFQVSENMKSLDQEKWRTLAQLLAEVDQALAQDDWERLKTDLPQLEMKDCKTADWRPEFNRCSYAICPPETGNLDPSYFEESFAAWNIEIMLTWGEMATVEAPVLLNESEKIASEELAHAKVPLSDADLKRWWDSKTDVRDLLTKDELLALVRSKFPDKHVSRDRVRDLVGARKRGPKGISGKKPAK